MTEPVVVDMAEMSEPICSEIRRRCGHGCIRCGVTVYLYVSLPIEVPEDGWTMSSVGLLCPSCLALLRSRPVSAAQYQTLLSRPVARDPEFDRRHLPYYVLLPELRAGGPAPVRDTAIPVMFGEAAPLVIAPPLHGIGATRLTLSLADADGVSRTIIDTNRWCPPDEGWTFAHRGSRYIVEKAGADARAELDFTAPGHLAIVQLRTRIGNHWIDLTRDWLEIDGERRVGLIASGRLIGYCA